VKIVYTVSDKNYLIPNVLRSLRSVQKFCTPQNIIIFYTPPRSKENFQKLSELAIVRKVPNITNPFAAFPTKGKSHYGEKIHLCSVDDPTILFLDADTFVRKDLRPLLVGNYDFSARVGSGYSKMNHEVWRTMFENYGKQPIPLPNTGFMIFKNYTHKHIRREWLRFLNENLPNPLPHSYLKEQYALALALSDRKIKWMTSKEHAFRWEGELGWRSYVIHGYHNPFRKRIAKFWRKIRKRVKI